MAVELATAYIALVPSLKGASQKISQELGSVDTASAGSEMGRKMGGGMVGSIKSLVGPAIGLLATGAFAGFIKDAASASDATDKFKATMSFAGLDTSAITKAKDAAKEYADQTVYDLPTIQNMTAQLASNGVADYTGLTKAAGNLNAVAGGNAETFKSVAMVMTQTAGAGKLTTENWNQMADAIPGAAGPLMKSLQEAGAYTGNFRDAMAAGQISSDEFNASLMKLGNDPVAVEAAKSTKTFEGAIGSLQATINSGLMGALDAMKPAITGAISGLSTGLGAIFTAFGAIFELFKTGNFNGGIRKALGLEEDSPIIGAILTIRGGFVAMFAAFKAGDGDVTSSGFAGFMERVGNAGVRVVGVFRTVRDAFANFFAGLGMGKGEVAAIGGDLDPIVGIGVKVRDAFGSIATAIGPLISNVVQLWSSFSPLQLIFKSIEPFLPQLLDMFVQLAGVVGGTLVSAIMGILPSIMQLQSVFVGLLQGVLATALPLVVQLVTMLGQTFTQLIPIVVPIITQIATLAMTLVSQLAPILMKLISTVMPMVVKIFGGILQAIGPVIQTIAGMLIPLIQFLMPVVVTVFGVIADIITSVMQIVMGIIQVVTGIISGNWSQVWEGIVNIFGGIWNTIVALVGGALAILWSIITSALGGVFSFIGNALGNIGKFFADIWNGIVGFLSGVWNAIVGAVVGYVTWYLKTIIDGFMAVWNFISGIFTAIGNFIGGVWNWIVTLVSNIIKAFVKVHGDQIMGIWNFIVGIFTAIGNFFMGIWNWYIGIIIGVLTAIWGVISGVFTAVWNFIVGLFTTIGAFIAGVWNAVVGTISGAVTAVWNFISAGFGMAWAYISAVFGQVAGYLGGIWDNIVNGVSGMIGQVGGFFSGLWDTITGALAGAGQWLFDAGKNIVNGLFDGIKSLAGTIGSFFLSLLPGWIVEPFKVALDIHSPSRVFRKLGRHIPEGVMLGVEDGKTDLGASMRDLVTVPDIPTYRAASASSARASEGHGPRVEQHIHPAPGMSEETIGRVAAHSMNYELRRSR